MIEISRAWKIFEKLFGDDFLIDFQNRKCLLKCSNWQFGFLACFSDGLDKVGKWQKRRSHSSFLRSTQIDQPSFYDQRARALLLSFHFNNYNLNRHAFRRNSHFFSEKKLANLKITNWNLFLLSDIPKIG